MLIGIYNRYHGFNKNNAIFNKENYPIGEDLGYPIKFLREKSKELGIQIDTLDLHSLSSYNKILFLDYPGDQDKTFKKLISLGKELYLITLESIIMCPENFLIEKHKSFKKIFTWNDNFVDGNRYIKLCLANNIKILDKDERERKKFCVMIAGNKEADYPFELYGKRREAIKWFQENHPNDFDLYGVGWNKAIVCNYRLFDRILNRVVPFIKNRNSNNLYPSYLGPVKSKIDTLKKYKFCICFENVANIPGYITEKIFDCMMAGCIPIYLGADNVEDYIPPECFIDMRKYKDFCDLYKEIISMDNYVIDKYKKNIEKYILNSIDGQFSAEYFSNTIINNAFLEKA